MTDQQLIDDFFALESSLEEERCSELSYLLMQAIARMAKSKGWNMAQLAEAMGAHRSQVSRWLSGSADMRLSTIAKFEAALQSPILEVDREESLVFARRKMPAQPPSAIVLSSEWFSESLIEHTQYHWDQQLNSAIAA